MTLCSHLETIDLPVLTPDERLKAVCEDCVKDGSEWVHLRQCRTCGHIGCCDSSLNRHARRHAMRTGHVVMSSAEVDELWTHCFADKITVDIEADRRRYEEGD